MSDTTELYLSLLKEALMGTIYRDPPVDPWNGIVKNDKGEVVKWGRAPGVLSIEAGPYNETMRVKGLDWPATAHTMIGRQRLGELERACMEVLRDGVPGDFVETGVWRGGACIFMAGLLRAMQSPDDVLRRVFVCDSFEGLPPPNVQKYPYDKNDIHYMVAPLLAVSVDQVQDNFRRYGLLDERIVFVKGWFKDTLPDLDTNHIALLRLDGDMYESTWDALTALYSRVSPGGCVVVDDYNAVRGCQKAVHAFLDQIGLSPSVLEVFDNGGAHWRKSAT